MNRWQDKEERTVRLFAQAEEVIRQTFDDEKGMRDYLDFRFRVPGYSAHNTAMMKAQRPEAQLAGSFQYWKEHGLYIRRGEQGMAILAPAKGENGNTAFALRYTFDLNQTNADKEKKNEMLSQWKSGSLKESDYDSLFSAIYETAAENKLKISFLNEPFPEKTGEVYDKDNTVFLTQTGEMSKQVEQAIRLLSMALLERKEKWTPMLARLQADIVQYLLCKSYGLDTSQIHFQELLQRDVRTMKITEKKKLLGDAFAVADSLREQLEHSLAKLTQKKEPEKMSLEDFLGKRGLLFPVSDYMIDKQKLPHGMTSRGRQRFEKDAGNAIENYHEKRNAAIEEYNNLVRQGKIISKTAIERELEIAHGHPDNESVQAARRVLEKRGIDWITGKPLAVDSNTIKNKEEKQPKVPVTTDKGKIEDFGKKIGGARKDLWKERGLDISDIAEMNEAETAKYITKDNIWEKPDYLQMIQEGTPVRVAYFIKEVRKSLPAKVTYSYMDTTQELKRKRQEDYISLIKDVKKMLLKVKSDTDILHVFDDFVNSGVYVERSTPYMVVRTEKGFAVTNKMLKAMQIRRTDFQIMDNRIEREQFGVPAEERLPKGFSVRYLSQKKSYVVLKGRRILAEGIESEQEAYEKAKELHKEYGGTRKKKFVPEQLEHIVRDGPANGITAEKSANGNMYIETFGFSGGEFGNWMNETDRQVSLNMGYDAFCDLAIALDMDISDVSIGNRLSIAFGSRGHGNAVAHYEPLREVINLTKMRGAGSLAHEWGHAFDDIMGKRLGLDGFMTENLRDKRVPASMKHLLETMKYRPETEEEAQVRSTKRLERDGKHLDELLEQILPEGKLNDNQKKEWAHLKEEIKSTAQVRSIDVEKEEQDSGRRVKWITEKIEELSNFKKSVTGHMITKDIRNLLYYATYSFECDFRGPHEKLEVETDFYKNSVKADSLHSKEDNGYWHSNAEMFARAFACYVHDKLPWRSDYLCGHSERAMAWDFSKEEPGLVKMFPEGKERERINKCFDEVFAECKKLGLLKTTDKEENNWRQAAVTEQIPEAFSDLYQEELKNAVEPEAAVRIPIRKKGRIH